MQKIKVFLVFFGVLMFFVIPVFGQNIFSIAGYSVDDFMALGDGQKDVDILVVDSKLSHRNEMIRAYRSIIPDAKIGIYNSADVRMAFRYADSLRIKNILHSYSNSVIIGAYYMDSYYNKGELKNEMVLFAPLPTHYYWDSNSPPEIPKRCVTSSYYKGDKIAYYKYSRKKTLEFIDTWEVTGSSYANAIVAAKYRCVQKWMADKLGYEPGIKEVRPVLHKMANGVHTNSAGYGIIDLDKFETVFSEIYPPPIPVITAQLPAGWLLECPEPLRVERKIGNTDNGKALSIYISPKYNPTPDNLPPIRLKKKISTQTYSKVSITFYSTKKVDIYLGLIGRTYYWKGDQKITSRAGTWQVVNFNLDTMFQTKDGKKQRPLAYADSIFLDIETSDAYLFLFIKSITMGPHSYNFETTDVALDDKLVPIEFALSQNYPNPFNPTTTIPFSLPKPSEVKLIVYNSLGQEIATLATGRYSAGKHSVTWEAQNEPGGVYICKLVAGNFTAIKKMLLLK